ncbi:MAG: homogentisate 1,2-dioxygenase [Sandaracinaceae bacterium]|nr:homogentisate 1,2-dioxygenase [Sandaracinaceae bacterium]
MHWIRGKVARQAHVGLPPGTVEEEFGRRGFFGRYAHLYRTAPPVGWTRIEGELKPRAYAVDRLSDPSDGYLPARKAFLANDDVTLRFARVDAPMRYWFRNADADEILFVHEGAGLFECDFGTIGFEAGHYLVVPRGTVHRLVPSAPVSLLVVESRGEVALPDKGLLGQHALFDPAVIDVPEPSPPAPEPGRTEYEVRVQRCGRITSIVYPFHPINTVGWKGDLTVWRLHVRDIRPVSSERYHLPPSAHATFVGEGWVLCTFLPRALETGDPEALRVPFYHSNIDYDEVLFYHAGDFFSREGIDRGMVTFHPQGIHHGPQPGAVAAAADKTRTDEIAVMIDTLRPLEPTADAGEVELADYWKSWQPREAR